MTRGWPGSLTARLALLFAMLISIALAGAGIFMYRSLATQFDERDDMELISKVAQIRHLLGEVDSFAAVQIDAKRFLDAVFGHDGLILTIKSSTGETLVQNTQTPGPLPALPFSAVNVTPEMGAIQNWRTPSGNPARGVAARGAIGSGRDIVDIVIVRVASDRTSLLADYRRDLIASIVLTSLFASILSYLVTSRALRPIREIAFKANEVTASHLDARLHVDEAPSELHELIIAFNRMLDRLEDSFRRLSQFSSDLAHDLRTPVSNIMVQTQVALSQPRSNEEYQALMVSSVEELERLTRMIEKMLFLARADNAQVALRPEVIVLREEVGKLIAYFEGLAEEAGVSLTFVGDGELLADRSLFQRAASNLIANAIRFTPRGNAVTIKSVKVKNSTEIIVSNPGPGITPDHQSRVFDRFYRVDDARRDSSSSSGLGLAIVKSIMKLHGGAVHVASEPGGNTAFTLTFTRQNTPSGNRP